MMEFRKGSPIPATLRERVQRAIEAHGHRAVFRAVGLSEGAFWRAVGGGPVHAGTPLMFERGLSALE
jgi:hypothetical protein